MKFLAAPLGALSLVFAAAACASPQTGAPQASSATLSASLEMKTTSSAPLAWSSDLKPALERARGSGKPVFVDFFASWCGPCHLLEKTTFQDERVKAKLQGRELVRIDVDQSPELARHYKVRAIPTLVCLDSKGTERKRSTGYVEPSEFLALMERCPSAGNPAPKSAK